ncbi:MAG: hypothetical protein ABSA93_24980 [Streptosporangiaceae bacterium]
MTNPADLSPRERNQFMMDKIRADGPAPYQEGRYVLRVVSVTGRKTGQPRPWPIAIQMVAGDRYLCAPNRRRDWVRNLLAAGECEIEGDLVPRHRAVLVEDDTAATAVHAYLSALGRASDEWPFPVGTSVPEIAKHVTEIAVFRLESAYPR